MSLNGLLEGINFGLLIFDKNAQYNGSFEPLRAIIHINHITYIDIIIWCFDVVWCGLMEREGFGG